MTAPDDEARERYIDRHWRDAATFEGGPDRSEATARATCAKFWDRMDDDTRAAHTRAPWPAESALLDPRLRPFVVKQRTLAASRLATNMRQLGAELTRLADEFPDDQGAEDMAQNLSQAFAHTMTLLAILAREQGFVAAIDLAGESLP